MGFSFCKLFPCLVWTKYRIVLLCKEICVWRILNCRRFFAGRDFVNYRDGFDRSRDIRTNLSCAVFPTEIMTTERTLTDVEQTTFNHDNSSGYESSTNGYVDTNVSLLYIGKTSTLIKSSILLFVVFVCIFGNGVMVAGIWKTPHMRSNSNILVASLTFADIIMGFGAIVLIISQSYVYIFSGNPCHYKKIVGVFLPFIKIPPQVVNGHIIAIAIDRFIAIVYPFFYSTRVTTHIAYLFIAGSYFYGFMVVLPLFQYLRFVDWRSCDLPYSLKMVGILDVGSYVIISVTMVTVYAKILLIAKAHKTKIENLRVVHRLACGSEPSCGQPGAQPSYDSQQEFKCTRVTAIILVAYIVFWFPFTTGRFLQGIIGDMRPYTQYFVDLGISIGHFSSAINWFVYGLHDRDFRHYVAKFVCTAKS